MSLYKGRHRNSVLIMWLSEHAEVVSKIEGEDDEEDDVPETIEMVVEGGNQQTILTQANKQQRP